MCTLYAFYRSATDGSLCHELIGIATTFGKFYKPFDHSLLLVGAQMWSKRQGQNTQPFSLNDRKRFRAVGRIYWQ